MLEQKITLRAKTVGFQPVIKTSQGDTGRKLLCSFEDFTIPDSSTAKIYVMKPSGKSVQNDATISDQTITVELTNQILAEKGIVACQIQVLNSGKAVKSFEFSLDNERSLAGDWPESENENTFLEGVVSEMQEKLTETINLANAATSAANTATQNANTATTNANAAADEARKTIWNNKNLTNSTSAAESQVETAAGAAVLTGVDGKTEQVTTTGAQLFDASKLLTKTLGNVTITNNDDGSFTISGSGVSPGSGMPRYDMTKEESLKILKVGTLRLSGESNVRPKFMAGIRNATSGVFSKSVGSVTNKTLEITAEDIESINNGTNVFSFCFYDNSSVQIVTGTIKPMVYMVGDGIWEPYTGGIPGPNSDYPIPIQGVGGETGNESFGLNATIQSYQLFDASKIPEKTKAGVTVKYNGDGSFTIEGTGETSESFYTTHDYSKEEALALLKVGTVYRNFDNLSVVPRFIFGLRNKETLSLVSGKNVQNSSESFEITSEDIQKIISEEYCLTATFYEAAGVEIKPGTIKPMIYQDGDGIWESYHRSEIPVTLTQPIFDGDKIIQIKAGQTYIDVDGAMQTADRDLWGVYKEKKYYECTGDENVISGSKGLYFILNDIAYRNAVDDKIKCNYFKSGTWVSGLSEGEFCQGSGMERIVGFKSSKFSTPDDLKEYFRQKKSEGNPVVAVLIYEKPRFVPFSDQKPFFGWTTPTGGCTITTDDIMKPIISTDTAQTPEGSYLLTGYIEGLRGRSLEQRILNLENNITLEV